jgi:hypothetical protein
MKKVTERYRVTCKQSAFFGQTLDLEERVPYRDGTVSLWLIHPEYGTLSFRSIDCEIAEVVTSVTEIVNAETETEKV